MLKKDPNMSKHVITGDEIWTSHYDPVETVNLHVELSWKSVKEERMLKH